MQADVNSRVTTSKRIAIILHTAASSPVSSVRGLKKEGIQDCESINIFFILHVHILKLLFTTATILLATLNRKISLFKVIGSHARLLKPISYLFFKRERGKYSYCFH